MSKIQLYIEDLIFNKKKLEFKLHELVNSDLIFDEFKTEMDTTLNDIYMLDVKINLMREYLKPEENDNP